MNRRNNILILLTLLKVFNWCWINPKRLVVKFSYQPLYLLENLEKEGCALVTSQCFLEKLGMWKYQDGSTVKIASLRILLLSKKPPGMWIQLLQGQGARVQHLGRKMIKNKIIFLNFKGLVSFRGFQRGFFVSLFFVNCKMQDQTNKGREDSN